jgi:hypothetical protein
MASGDTLATFFPADNEPPNSNPAALDVRNGVPVLDFDASSPDESAVFSGFMPRHYDGGGITVTVGWAATSATSGTISLDVSFMSISDDADDLDSKSFAAANNANPTAASASGEVDYATVTFTDGADMDSIAAGEFFRMTVARDADGTTSTDNMTGDMELVFVEIKET